MASEIGCSVEVEVETITYKSSWKRWITRGPCNYNENNKLFRFVHQFVFEISLPHLNKLTQHITNYTVKLSALSN